MPLVVWTRSLLLFSATSKGSTVKTVTLDVRPPTEAMADFAQAWKTGKGSKADRISFATPELLWKALTAKRWELLSRHFAGLVRSRCARQSRCQGGSRSLVGPSISWRTEPHGVRAGRVPVRGGQGRVLAAGGLRRAVGSNLRQHSAAVVALPRVVVAMRRTIIASS
jgi:hypothetical protein